MMRLKPIRSPRRKASRMALFSLYRALYRHYGPRHWWPADTPFEVVVGAILTQNTAWKNVEKAIRNLKGENLLSPARLSGVSVSKLAGLIRPAGYFNVKAARLKNFLQFLKKKYQNQLANLFRLPLSELRSELLSVNGIGEETADSIILYAADRGIFVVDAYTRRLLARHRYIRGDETYGSLQLLFHRALPRRVSLFNEFHALIVETGKDYCRKTPRCETCPLRKYL